MVPLAFVFHHYIFTLLVSFPSCVSGCGSLLALRGRRRRASSVGRRRCRASSQVALDLFPRAKLLGALSGRVVVVVVRARRCLRSASSWGSRVLGHSPARERPACNVVAKCSPLVMAHLRRVLDPNQRLWAPCGQGRSRRCGCGCRCGCGSGVHAAARMGRGLVLEREQRVHVAVSSRHVSAARAPIMKGVLN